tara:strand:- start:445 stop:585 length:141 start_codon:yes stop_codon:yes gene_type:complete
MTIVCFSARSLSLCLKSALAREFLKDLPFFCFEENQTKENFWFFEF